MHICNKRISQSAVISIYRKTFLSGQLKD